MAKSGGSITFDFEVGSRYPIHHNGQSATLDFVGMITTGRRNVLLFHNPNHLGVPYDYIGCIPETVWPDIILPTVTVEFRLRAKFVGQSLTALTQLTGSQTQVWGSGTQG
tara:strand:- start:3155 stop:3484 length:330 start_codon:yes stop_codon:yes gene_type:complete